jgi:hypothetical protein
MTGEPKLALVVEIRSTLKQSVTHKKHRRAGSRIGAKTARRPRIFQKWKAQIGASVVPRTASKRSRESLLRKTVTARTQRRQKRREPSTGQQEKTRGSKIARNSRSVKQPLRLAELA